MIRFLLNIMIGFLLIHKISCGYEKENNDTGSPYDLGNPLIVKLPVELDKIPGICFYPKDTAIFAVSNESGRLFKIRISDRVIISIWKLSESRNFQDVVLKDSNFFVLSKRSSVLKFTFQKNNLTRQEFRFPSPDTNGYKSMFFDDKSRVLKVLCYDKSHENKHLKLSGFSIDILSEKISDSLFSLVKTDGLADSGLSIFRPSAAAINPLTKELFILSSANKMLVVADRDGGVKKCFHLSPTVYSKRGGICFTPG
jgi:uncharacterized protein YjiK